MDCTSFALGMVAYLFFIAYVQLYRIITHAPFISDSNPTCLVVQLPVSIVFDLYAILIWILCLVTGPFLFLSQ